MPSAPAQAEGNPTQPEGNPTQPEGNPTQLEGSPTQPEGSPTQPGIGAEQLEIERAQVEGDDTRLELDETRRVLTFARKVVRLTRTEYRLFAHLVDRAECWVATAELIREVLGTHHRPDTPIVRVHVHALRRKLGSSSVWLESDPHRTLGYRWVGPVPRNRRSSGSAED